MHQIDSEAHKEMLEEDRKAIKEHIKVLIRQKHGAMREGLRVMRYVNDQIADIRSGKVTAEDIRREGMMHGRKY